MRGWLQKLTIVPEAHVQLSEFELQATLYEVFHTRPVSRVGHAVATPIVLGCAMLLLDRLPFTVSGVPVAGEVGVGAMILAAGLIAYTWGLEIVTGLLATPYVIGLLFASWALGPALAGVPAWALALAMLAASALQAGTHCFEPIPPPWSRTHTFRPARDVAREMTWRELPGVLLLTLTAFLLEWWASFRIFALQLSSLAMALGLRPALRQRIAARCVEAFADHRALWPSWVERRP